MDHPVVLLVEDHHDTRAAVETFLELEGYDVVSAGNGREALRVLASGVRPCAIILDLLMPDMTGKAFRTEQVANPAWAPIPVIVHSAVPAADSDAVRMGVQFLRKPADPRDLLTLLRTCCSTSSGS